MTSSFGDGVTVVDQAAVYVVQPKCRSLSTTRRERNGAHPAPPGPSLTGHGTGPLLALVRWVRVAQFQRSRWNTAIHHGRLAALVNLQTRRIHFPLFVPLGFVFDFLPKTISMKFFSEFFAPAAGTVGRLHFCSWNSTDCSSGGQLVGTERKSRNEATVVGLTRPHAHENRRRAVWKLTLETHTSRARAHRANVQKNLLPIRQFI